MRLSEIRNCEKVTSSRRRNRRLQAAIRTETDGTVNLRLDEEAAQAVFASLVFAARFHEGIAPLAAIAAERLRESGALPTPGGRRKLCQ